MMKCGKISRRELIREACAIAALAGMPAKIWGATRSFGKPELVIGLLSDIHVQLPPAGNADTIARFKHALEYFRGRGVDGVLVAGDLTNAGLETELEAVAKTWFEVFPDGKLPDGRKVANLMHYGDHDAEARFYTQSLKDKFAQVGLDVPRSMSEGENRKHVWERLFHEPWSPVRSVRVKGYDFVLSNFMREGSASAPADLAAQLGALNLNPAKPFFYSQHRWIRGTYLADEEMWGGDNGVAHDVLRKFPNAIACQGHTHYTIADDRSLWIGDYTSVNCGSLYTQGVARRRENGPDISWYKEDYMRDSQMASVKESQAHVGMVMSVYKDVIVLERREFGVDAQLGPDLVFATDPKVRKPNVVRKTESVAPEFAAGATVEVSARAGHDRAKRAVDQVVVRFPTVASEAGRPRAFDYVVRAERVTGEIVREKRVFSPRITLPEQCDVEMAECVFSKAEVAGAAKFTVRPANCWGKTGAPISTLWSGCC